MPGAKGRRERAVRAAAMVLAVALGGCGWVWMEQSGEPGEREETAPSVGRLVLKPVPEREAPRPPGTPVADPFRPSERVADWGGTRVHAGGAGRAAYVYTPDYASALVAGRPERAVTDLAFERGDWHIACGVAGEPDRCHLRRLARIAPGGRAEAALAVRSEPGRAGPTVCAGPPGATGVALRTGESAPWRYGAGNRCFGLEDSTRILAELTRSPAFAFAYTSVTGEAVSGSASTFGLVVGLELMGWLDARRAAAPAEGAPD
jgi:hypothetical protein